MSDIGKAGSRNGFGKAVLAFWVSIMLTVSVLSGSGTFIGRSAQQAMAANPPTLSSIAASPSLFSPSGGGTTTISFTSDQAGTFAVTITNSSSNIVATLGPFPLANGSNAAVWNGFVSTSTVAPDGPYTFYINATDPTNSFKRIPPTGGDGVVTIDTTPPMLTITNPTNGTTLSSSSLVANGTASDDSGLASVQVSVDSGPYQVALGTTSWSFTTNQLTSGAHTISVKATDNAGNIRTVSSSFTVSLGSPTVSITSPANRATLTTTTPTISGTASDTGPAVIQSVQVSIDGGAYQPATGNTSWTFTPASALPTGPHNATAKATDSASLVVTSGTIQFTINPPSPAPTLTSISASPNPFSPNGDGIQDTTTISFTSDQAGTYSIDIKDSTATIKRTLTGNLLAGTNSVVWDGKDSSNTVVPDGTYSYFITATASGSGNTRPPPTGGDGTATVDNTPPIVTIASPANNALMNNNTPVISGTASDVSGIQSVTVQIDSNSFTPTGTTSWSYTPTTPLSDGSHTVAVKATDNAGNSATTSISITIDTIAPSVSITFPTDGAVLASSTTALSGTASDSGSGVKLVEVSVDNGATYNAASGTNSWTYATPAMTNGAHTIIARATDNAGNKATTSISVTVNVPAPSISSISASPTTIFPNGGGTTTISFTSDQAGTYSIAIKDSTSVLKRTLTETLSAGPNSAVWHGKDSTGTVVPDGNYSLFITATNGAGGTRSSPSPDAIVTVDDTPPSVAINSPTGGSTIFTPLPNVTGTASDALSGLQSIQLKFDSGAFQTASGTTSWSFTPSVRLSNGIHTVTVKAINNAGISSNVSSSFKVQLQTPKLLITTLKNNANVTSTTPTISGTASVKGALIQTVQLTIDGGPWQLAAVNTSNSTLSATAPWSFTPSTPLNQGFHTVKVQAISTWGTNKTVTIPKFTVDSIPPSIQISSPLNATIIHSSLIKISGTASDTGTGVRNVTVSVDSSSPKSYFNATTTNSFVNWSFSPSALQDGNHTISARAFDRAGNVAFVNITVIILTKNQNASIAITGFNNNTSVEWGTDSISLLGNSTAPGTGYHVDAFWGDGTNTSNIQISSAGSWPSSGTVSHKYGPADSGLTRQINAILYNSTGFQQAISLSYFVRVLPHNTTLTLNPLNATVAAGASFTASGTLFDNLTGQQIPGATITFTGSGTGSPPLPNANTMGIVAVDSGGLLISSCATCTPEDGSGPSGTNLLMLKPSTGLIMLPPNNRGVELLIQGSGHANFTLQITQHDNTIIDKGSSWQAGQITNVTIPSSTGIRQVSVLSVNGSTMGPAIGISSIETINPASVPKDQIDVNFQSLPVSSSAITTPFTFAPGSYSSTTLAQLTPDTNLFLQARFAGDSSYLPSNSNIRTYDVTASSNGLSISLVLLPDNSITETAIPGEQVTLSATVTDGLGKPKVAVVDFFQFDPNTSLPSSSPIFETHSDGTGTATYDITLISPNCETDCQFSASSDGVSTDPVTLTYDPTQGPGVTVGNTGDGSTPPPDNTGPPPPNQGIDLTNNGDQFPVTEGGGGGGGGGGAANNSSSYFYSSAGSLNITTDRTDYQTGQDVTIMGNSQNVTSGHQVSVQIFNPNNALYTNASLSLDGNGTFRDIVSVNGSLGISGDYAVLANYAGLSAHTVFHFTSLETLGQTYDLSVGTGIHPLKYEMTGGKIDSMSVNLETKALFINIMPTGFSGGTFKIDIPRAVLDSRSADGQSDSKFTVFTDQNPRFDFNESKSADARTITINFDGGTHQIIIIGTQIVPEFGLGGAAVAPVLMAIAMVSVLIVGSRFGLWPAALRRNHD